MKLTDLFINGKKVNVQNKSKVQLEHMLQLAKDEVRRYEVAIKNYPPERMEKFGKPHLQTLQSYVDHIQQALDTHE